MGEAKEVKLFGMCASPYTKRVEMALKIKGIPFDYVEEDLSNKSILLLQYNPVHKKVPVLFHEGRRISESLVILEYIDENWLGSPFLLPEDPYERAKACFWASFFDQQLLQSLTSIFMHVLEGSDKEEVMKEWHKNLKALEEGNEDLFSSSNLFSQGRTPGFLDIVVSSILEIHQAFEQVFGEKIIDPQKNPLIFSWLTDLTNLPVGKDTLPPHDLVVENLHVSLKKAKQSELQ